MNPVLQATIAISAGGAIAEVERARRGLNGFSEATGFLRSHLGALVASFVSTRGVMSALGRGGALSALSTQTGQNIRDLVTLQSAFENSGIGAESLRPLVQYLQRSLSGLSDEGEKTDAVFSAMGLDRTALQAQDLFTQFRQLGEGLRSLSSNGDRIQALRKLLGREGGRALPLLMNPEELDRAARSMGRMGSYLDLTAGGLKQASNGANDLRENFNGFGSAVAVTLTPALKDLLKTLGKFDNIKAGETVGGAAATVVDMANNVVSGVSGSPAATGIVKTVAETALTAWLTKKVFGVAAGAAARVSKVVAAAENAVALNRGAQALRGASPELRGLLARVAASRGVATAAGAASAGVGEAAAAGGGVLSAGGLAAAGVAAVAIGAALYVAYRLSKMVGENNAWRVMHDNMVTTEKDLRKQISGISTLTEKNNALSNLEAQLISLRQERSSADPEDENRVNLLDEQIRRYEFLKTKVEGMNSAELKSIEDARERERISRENTAVNQNVADAMNAADKEAEGKFSFQQKMAGATGDAEQLALIRGRMAELRAETQKLAKDRAVWMDPEAFKNNFEQTNHIKDEIRDLQLEETRLQKPDKASKETRSAPSILSDQLSRVGGFLGAGLPGLDVARRTATHTERTAKGVEKLAGLFARAFGATGESMAVLA